MTTSAEDAERAVLGKHGLLAETAPAQGAFASFDLAPILPAGTDSAVAAALAEAESFWESRLLGYRLPGAAVEPDLAEFELHVALVDIDGRGGTLGSAASGSTVRVDDRLLPTNGALYLDTADVDAMGPARLDALVRHEVAHALGFSDLFWAEAGAIAGTGADTAYTGAFALAAYRAEFDAGATHVPIEGEIGGRVRPGTSYVHWDEALFADHLARTGNTRNPELMTGYLTTAEPSVSDTTVASFADLGYLTNIDFADAPGDDFGQTPGSAGSLAIGASLTGTLALAGDRDWIGVTLAAGLTYRFDLRGTDGGLADPLLRLHDAEGAPLAEDDDSGPGLDASLVFTTEQAGTVFLSAGAFADTGTGAYELSTAIETPRAPADAPPEARDDATTLPAGRATRVDVLANDTDPEGLALVLDSIIEGPDQGDAAIADGQILYTPEPGFAGQDSLVYQVTDAAGGASEARLALTVLAPPSPSEGVLRAPETGGLIALADGSRYLGGPGEDRFLASEAMAPGETSILEGGPGDVLILAPGLEVVASRALGAALELSLAGGAVLQVLEADSLAFELGGNPTTGTEGVMTDLEGLAARLGLPAGPTEMAEGDGFAVPGPAEAQMLTDWWTDAALLDHA